MFLQWNCRVQACSECSLSDLLKNSQYQCPPEDPLWCLIPQPTLHTRHGALSLPCLHAPLWPKVEIRWQWEAGYRRRPSIHRNCLLATNCTQPWSSSIPAPKTSPLKGHKYENKIPVVKFWWRGTSFCVRNAQIMGWMKILANCHCSSPSPPDPASQQKVNLYLYLLLPKQYFNTALTWCRSKKIHKYLVKKYFSILAY